MKTIFYILFSLVFVLVADAQTYIDPPSRDAVNRDSLSFYDYYIDHNTSSKKECYYLCSNSTREIAPLTGRFKFYDTNSRTIDLELKDGLAEGEWQYYGHTFEGPIIVSVVNFENGCKNGTETRYSYQWDKSVEHFLVYLRGIAQYNRGFKQNDISYWDNGQLIYNLKYDDEGRDDGPYVFYNRDGSIDFKGENVHGVYTGIWEYYYPGTDIIKELRMCKDGFLYSISYYKNGNPWVKSDVKNQLYEDDYVILSEVGDTIEYHFYKHGIEQGYQVKSYSTGYNQPRYTSHYFTDANGVYSGPYKERFASGKLRVEGQYDCKGVRDGTWIFHVEDGRVYRTESYVDGSVVATSMRELNYLRTDIPINPQYHLGEFPSGKTPQKIKPIPFFLFSE